MKGEAFEGRCRSVRQRIGPDALLIDEFPFQVPGARGLGIDRRDRSAPVLLSGSQQLEEVLRRLAGEGQMAVEAESRLRLPYDVLPAEGDVLRPARGRYLGQEELRDHHEELRSREDSEEGSLVRAGILPARLHRYGVGSANGSLPATHLPLPVAGKMFRCVELPMLIQFFIMFYNDKPVDWLIDDLLSTKVCGIDFNPVSNFLLNP